MLTTRTQQLEKLNDSMARALRAWRKLAQSGQIKIGDTAWSHCLDMTDDALADVAISKIQKVKP